MDGLAGQEQDYPHTEARRLGGGIPAGGIRIRALCLGTPTSGALLLGTLLLGTLPLGPLAPVCLVIPSGLAVPIGLLAAGPGLQKLQKLRVIIRGHHRSAGRGTKGPKAISTRPPQPEPEHRTHHREQYRHCQPGPLGEGANPAPISLSRIQHGIQPNGHQQGGTSDD